jgi:acetyl/propionyl-CoA carboxylase alpha subunit
MKVLVANRGEIACRILRTLGELGIRSVAVYTDVDEGQPHVWLADEAQPLGGPDRYLSVERILTAARRSDATAVHPGYGFLSENPEFARACAGAGLTFIGPSPDTMASFGDKRAARVLAMHHGVPVVPGAQACDSMRAAEDAAAEVGFPVLLKAAAGGGGRGMRAIEEPAQLADAFTAAQREAEASFGDGRLLMEKLVHPARHIEVQILGDGNDVVALGERECSLQRRYQKLVEESPSPGIDDGVRRHLSESAVQLARAVHYRGAGTVEFLVGPDGSHYFLEVNSRLQVEHPVTEARTGLDLVKLQIEVASGGRIPGQPAAHGHAIEARLVAEDPGAGFLPSTGTILMLEWPTRPNVRVDAGIERGTTISAHYDSLLAKIIAWGRDREDARRRLVEALRETTVLGVATNQSFLIDVLSSDYYEAGETYTRTLEGLEWTPPPIPEFARLAAEGDGAPVVSSDNGKSGTYSPWYALGAFRVGR